MREYKEKVNKKDLEYGLMNETSYMTASGHLEIIERVKDNIYMAVISTPSSTMTVVGTAKEINNHIKILKESKNV